MLVGIWYARFKAVIFDRVLVVEIAGSELPLVREFILSAEAQCPHIFPLLLLCLSSSEPHTGKSIGLYNQPVVCRPPCIIQVRIECELIRGFVRNSKQHYVRQGNDCFGWVRETKQVYVCRTIDIYFDPASIVKAYVKFFRCFIIGGHICTPAVSIARQPIIPRGAQQFFQRGA